MSNKNSNNGNSEKIELLRKRDVFRVLQLKKDYLIKSMYKILSKNFDLDKE